MKTKRVYVCENSMEGIFTGIYDAWASRYGHEYNYIQVMDSENDAYNIALFSEYINVSTDQEKALKVANSICNKISAKAFHMVCHGLWSDDVSKGDVIYRFLILGFSMGGKVVNHLGDTSVMKLYELERAVSNEGHNYLGFLRFMETESNILIAKIKPKNDILRLVAHHFSDRLSTENFVIIDEARKAAIIHPKGSQWSYMKADTIDLSQFESFSQKEEKFTSLWKTFFNSIAIVERTNLKLQQQHVPKRFRENITEFTSIQRSIEREG